MYMQELAKARTADLRAEASRIQLARRAAKRVAAKKK
jgi:hypothetical protein